MTHLQFGVNLPRKAMQFDVGGGPYRPWVPSVTDLLGTWLVSKNGGGTNIQTFVFLPWWRTWMQEAAGGGVLSSGIGAGVCAALAFFSRRSMAAPVGPVASPLWAGCTQRGGSGFPWGKRFLLVFAHPGPMVHRPRGKAGWEMNHWWKSGLISSNSILQLEQ